MAKNSTFIKLDDTTPDHPKVDGLSNAAFRAWIEALCYCSEYLTDGVISRHRIGRRDGAKVVAELISVGLVRETDDPARVVIHDYLEHQTSRQQVVDIRAKRARAGSKTEAKRPPEVRSQKPEVITYGSDVLTPSVCIPKTDGVTANIGGAR